MQLSYHIQWNMSVSIIRVSMSPRNFDQIKMVLHYENGKCMFPCLGLQKNALPSEPCPQSICPRGFDRLWWYLILKMANTRFYICYSKRPDIILKLTLEYQKNKVWNFNSRYSTSTDELFRNQVLQLPTVTDIISAYSKQKGFVENGKQKRWKWSSTTTNCKEIKG